MALLAYQVRTFTLSATAAELIAPASASRVRLMLSGVPAGAGEIAALSPQSSVSADMPDANGITIDPTAGPLELCVETHGQLVQAPLYAIAQAAGFRLTVIEFTGNVGNGGQR